jgi:uncharacterized protein YjiS (DUF1127 family)
MNAENPTGRSGRISRWEVRAADSARDERNEQLERGGYLLIVYAERLVCGVTTLALGTGRSVMKLIMAPQQTSTRRFVSGPHRSGVVAQTWSHRE